MLTEPLCSQTMRCPLFTRGRKQRKPWLPDRLQTRAVRSASSSNGPVRRRPLAGCRLRTYNGVQREQRCKTAKYVSEAQRGGIRPGHGNYICRSGSGWPRRSETGLLRELRALRCCSCSGASAPVAPKAVPGLPVSARTSAVSRFRRPVPCARLARSADGAAPERRKKKKKEKSKHQHGTPRLSCFRGCSEG